MEGKYLRSVVIMGLLVLSMVVTEVEGLSCKSDSIVSNCFFYCVYMGRTESNCASLCDCKLGMAENGVVVEVTPAGSMSEYYCTFGCASSVCKDVTTGFKSGSGEGEEVKLAVEHCNKACSEICNNKGVEVVTA